MIGIIFFLIKIIISYIIGSVFGQICRAIGIGKGLVLLSVLVLAVLITGWIKIDLSILIPFAIGFVLGILLDPPDPPRRGPPPKYPTYYDRGAGMDGGREQVRRY